MVFFVFAALALSTNHSAANVSPVIDSVTAATTSLGNEAQLTLAPNSTTSLFAHGSISDTDGCEDVATNGTVSGTFYRSNHLNGSSCSPDNNDCYQITNASCSKSGCDGPEDTIFNYECSAQIQYYADSTTSGPHVASDWTVKITATDAATAQGIGTDTIEMATTVGLTIPSSIGYGTVNLDGESAEQDLLITNTGNSGIDNDLSVDADMSCTNGVVPAGNVHYATTASTAYTSGTALSTTAQEVELNLAPRSDDSTASTKNIYFKLKMPSSGAGGSCSNTLTVTAKADAENGW